LTESKVNQVKNAAVSNEIGRDYSNEVFALLGVRPGDYVVNLWKAFLDDSADEKREKLVVAGCLFGKKASWGAFNKEWRQAFREEPSIEYFHGKELSHLEGQFAQFRDPVKWPKPTGGIAANKKRDLLRAVIERQSAIVAFGCGILVPEYRRARESHPRGKVFLSKDPFEYVLQLVIDRAAKTIAEIDSKAKIGFISDDSGRAPVYSQGYVNWKERNPQTAKSIIGIGHFDDKNVYGLKAADMAASVVKGSFEMLEKGIAPQTGFPLESRFWRIEVHREDNLLRMLNAQPLHPSEAGG
jgi:hypothetical protein